jgi:hypothetical protein
MQDKSRRIGHGSRTIKLESVGPGFEPPPHSRCPCRALSPCRMLSRRPVTPASPRCVGDVPGAAEVRLLAVLRMELLRQGIAETVIETQGRTRKAALAAATISGSGFTAPPSPSEMTRHAPRASTHRRGVASALSPGTTAQLRPKRPSLRLIEKRLREIKAGVMDLPGATETSLGLTQPTSSLPHSVRSHRHGSGGAESPFAWSGNIAGGLNRYSGADAEREGSQGIPLTALELTFANHQPTPAEPVSPPAQRWIEGRPVSRATTTVPRR